LSKPQRKAERYFTVKSRNPTNFLKNRGTRMPRLLG
jgi:hypothetical protein